MSEPVSRGRRRSVTREEMLAVAKRHAITHGWRASRVQAIAAEVGVSRPTLYKEFPSKQELGIALVRDENARFVQALGDLLIGVQSLREGLEKGILFALTEVDRNPLLAMALREDGSEEGTLIPTITAGQHTILPLAGTVTSQLLAMGAPKASPERLAFVGDTIARLTFSHVLAPGDIGHAELARRIAALAEAMLEAP